MALAVGRSAIRAVVCLLAVIACGPTAAPSARPADRAAPPASGAAPAPGGLLERTVAAARAEGALTLVWSPSSLNSAEGMPRWIEGFNRQYGLNLDVRFTPGPSPPEMGARVVQEYQAGRPASSDVLLLAETVVASIYDAHALEPSDWLQWAPNVRDLSLIGPDGAPVQVGVRTPGITYNTARFPSETAPHGLQDLLQPVFKGHVATTPYAAGFDWLSTPEFWGKERTLEYARALAEQAAGQMRCGEMERIASGEFDALAYDCGTHAAVRPRRLGAPVTSVIPTDAAAMTYWYMAVPRNAVHPNAARLWINYLLGREAQDILWDVDGEDHYLVEGSHKAAEIDRLRASGAKIVQVNAEFFLGHDEQELNRTLLEVQRILRKE